MNSVGTGSFAEARRRAFEMRKGLRIEIIEARFEVRERKVL